MRTFIRLTAAALLVAAIALVCAGCGKNTMRIENLNKEANTFDFVDTKTGQTIQYDKLILNGKEVIDHQVMTGMADSVAFATEEGQIVREGAKVSVSGQGYTEAAELEYQLDGGTLTIIDSK